MHSLVTLTPPLTGNCNRKLEIFVLEILQFDPFPLVKSLLWGMVMWNQVAHFIGATLRARIILLIRISYVVYTRDLQQINLINVKGM